MMRLGRRASLLVAFSLFASAATAHAECAWVLWIETEAMSKDPSGRWKSADFYRNVYDTRKACEAAIVQSIEVEAQSARDAGIKVFRRGEDSTDYKDHYKRVDTVLLTVTTVFKERGPGLRNLYGQQYNCLPDTLDPRGPKGGAR